MLFQYNLNTTSPLIYCRKDSYTDYRRLSRVDSVEILLKKIGNDLHSKISEQPFKMYKLKTYLYMYCIVFYKQYVL